MRGKDTKLLKLPNLPLQLSETVFQTEAVRYRNTITVITAAFPQNLYGNYTVFKVFTQQIYRLLTRLLGNNAFRQYFIHFIHSRNLSGIADIPRPN
ncbi:Uncharacterised protein [Neisseria animalis]|nr:Uncharacterised protein [Neisseria animalis]